ncbi:alpha/beta fold hydrolase [Planctomicrobium sp. SH661]|uniref:alpha/beta fold hydrolase n=1 Tax=Planctomicrobium sp. SH661 TaxID=3448124 RepID=UPI003F5BC2A8
MTNSSPTGSVFTLRDFTLQCGHVLPDTRLVYQTYGTLNSQRSNVILYPTSYAAQHPDIEWLIGPERVLDPTRYFIIIPNMFGNGFSTSPSNQPELFNGSERPVFTHLDNVAAQYRLLQEQFGIEQLALIYGWSMGGQQALHWGALFPERVQRIAAVCTSAKTTPHNHVFLEGLKGALTADPAWNGAHFTSKPERGLRAFARIYAGWALSQAFYRERRYLELEYASLEDFLLRDWEASFLRRDAANLLSMIETWQRSDISDNNIFRGNLQAALGAIQAKTFLMPASTDLYFTPEDSLAELRHLPHAECRPIPSIWGHRAGNPFKSPDDEKFLRTAIAELLSA